MTDTATRSTYVIGSTFFLRSIGVVYLCAFASLLPQIAGLVGSEGLLPVTEFLEQVPYEGVEAWWRVPTLAWLSGADGFLRLLCVAGALSSSCSMRGCGRSAAVRHRICFQAIR